MPQHIFADQYRENYDEYAQSHPTQNRNQTDMENLFGEASQILGNT